MYTIPVTEMLICTNWKQQIHTCYANSIKNWKSFSTTRYSHGPMWMIKEHFWLPYKWFQTKYIFSSSISTFFCLVSC